MKKEKGHKKVQDVFIEAVLENPAVMSKALSDKRVQNAFVEAIGEDPELVEALSKITPEIGNVAAGWSCCRSDRPQVERPEEPYERSRK